MCVSLLFYIVSCCCCYFSLSLSALLLLLFTNLFIYFLLLCDWPSSNFWVTKSFNRECPTWTLRWNARSTIYAGATRLNVSPSRTPSIRRRNVSKTFESHSLSFLPFFYIITAAVCVQSNEMNNNKKKPTPLTHSSSLHNFSFLPPPLLVHFWRGWTGKREREQYLFNFHSTGGEWIIKSLSYAVCTCELCSVLLSICCAIFRYSLSLSLPTTLWRFFTIISYSLLSHLFSSFPADQQKQTKAAACAILNTLECLWRPYNLKIFFFSTESTFYYFLPPRPISSRLKNKLHVQTDIQWVYMWCVFYYFKQNGRTTTTFHHHTTIRRVTQFLKIAKKMTCLYILKLYVWRGD